MRKEIAPERECRCLLTTVDILYRNQMYMEPKHQASAMLVTLRYLKAVKYPDIAAAAETAYELYMALLQSNALDLPRLEQARAHRWAAAIENLLELPKP